MGAAHTLYMYSLPAGRNIEVIDGGIDGPHPANPDKAGNRLHAQKAAIAWTVS